MNVNDIIAMYPRFEIARTGGNCQAWRHPLENSVGGYLLITEQDEANLPPADATVVTAGRYDTAESEGLCEDVAVDQLKVWIDEQLLHPRFRTEYDDGSRSLSIYFEDEHVGDVKLSSGGYDGCANHTSLTVEDYLRTAVDVHLVVHRLDDSAPDLMSDLMDDADLDVDPVDADEEPRQ